MGCGCGKKGQVRHFSTAEQARIAKQRGTGVRTAAKVASPTAPASKHGPTK